MKITEFTCTGCGSCSVACPAQCILMKPDRLGRLTPKVDRSKCLHCGICVKTCPQNNKLPERKPVACYAAWSKCEEDYCFSASGGVAAALARYQLEQGDAVYGCDYDEKADLHHFQITDISGISRMQSSKYSQSRAYCCFREIKELLEKDVSVAFIGTPCQVAGLLSYLRKDYSSLITVDLVCHGTPPNEYLQRYLSEIKLKAPYQKIRFRGEYDQMLTVWEDGSIAYKEDRMTDAYFSAFYQNMISYDSCFSCRYAQPKRISDVTIGDFWGLGELKQIIKRSKRPSLVLVNTEKGQQFFKRLSGNLIFERREIMEGIHGNGRLNNPPGKSMNAKLFQFFYQTRVLGFSKSLKAALYSRAVIKWLQRILMKATMVKGKIIQMIKERIAS